MAGTEKDPGRQLVGGVTRNAFLRMQPKARAALVKRWRAESTDWLQDASLSVRERGRARLKRLTEWEAAARPAVGIGRRRWVATSHPGDAA